MKMSFRWYGDSDPVTLQYISQIPAMHSVVSAVYSVPPGEVWPVEAIRDIKEKAAAHGLVFDIVESVPVHEDIKLGKPSRDKYIEVYRENIRRLGKEGIKVICYNFMPVFDWLRSSLDYVNADGSTSLIYRDQAVLAMDPRAGDLSLPGWDASYTKEGLGKLLEEYKNIDDEALWANLKYFLEGIIPVCEEYDVKMAIHPDDPAWPIFGLPRIMTGKDSVTRLLDAVDKPYNGITLCTGSFGSNQNNDICEIIKACRGRIPFAHVRNLKYNSPRDFEEAAHLSSDGSMDMYKIIKTLYDTGFDGAIRPDHGRMIWDEVAMPGYGLYDRALGAAYLNGLWEAVDKSGQ